MIAATLANSFRQITVKTTRTGPVVFRNQKEKPELQIGIRAIRVKEEICRLETEISAPLGHLVVLGMTPFEGATSVFVVQILGPDVAKTTGRK